MTWCLSTTCHTSRCLFVFSSHAVILWLLLTCVVFLCSQFMLIFCSACDPLSFNLLCKVSQRWDPYECVSPSEDGHNDGHNGFHSNYRCIRSIYSIYIHEWIG